MKRSVVVVVVVVVRDAVKRSVSVAVTVAFVSVTVTSLVVGVMIQEHADRTNGGRKFLRTRSQSGPGTKARKAWGRRSTTRDNNISALFQISPS